jgi:hypothetical protein
LLDKPSVTLILFVYQTVHGFQEDFA